MSPLEVVAVCLGVANIVLLIRRSVWNYPVGIVMVSLYGWIFFHARLYSDVLLQGFFFVVQIVGWVAWLRKREADGSVMVERASRRQLLLAELGTAMGVAALGLTTRLLGAAYPFWDATVASASVAAQLLLTWRRIENWLWWIAADSVAICVYFAKGLYLTSGLYGLFLVMAVVGYRSWRKNLGAAPGKLVG